MTRLNVSLYDTNLYIVRCFLERDELIMSFKDVIETIVKKYNNFELDEDLMMVGYEETTKAVDRCIKENITNYNDIKNRVISWVKNGIIDEKRKLKHQIGVAEGYEEDYPDESIDSDYGATLLELRLSLNDKENKLLTLKLEGKTKDEIMREMNIGKSTYHNICNTIKKIILEK